MNTLICGSMACDLIVMFPDQFKKHAYTIQQPTAMRPYSELNSRLLESRLAMMMVLTQTQHQCTGRGGNDH